MATLIMLLPVLVTLLLLALLTGPCRDDVAATAAAFLNRPDAMALCVSSSSGPNRILSTVERDSDTLFPRRPRKREILGWAETATVLDMS